MGTKTIAEYGNTFHNTGWKIHGLVEGTYYWSVQAVDNGFAGSGFSPEATFIINTVSVTEGELNQTRSLNAFPNPCSQNITITYKLQEKSRVALLIYNTFGQLVFSIPEEELPAGDHSFLWNSMNASGAQALNGVYHCAVQSRDQVRSILIILVR